MLSSIVKKEWLKLKVYFLSLLLITIFSVLYFLFDLNFQFSTLEPKSMMWYKLAQLDVKPYYSFFYFFVAIGFIISFAQFLPEMVKDRIKIMTHLPKSLYSVLFIHLGIGVFFVLILTLFLAICLVFIIYAYYPSVAIYSIVLEFMFYIFGSVLTYLFISAVIIDKNKIFRLLKFLLCLVFLIAFFKDHYFWFDILWIALFLFLPFLVLDSLYSIKQQRLSSISFRLSCIFIVAFLFINTYINYKENYKKEFNDYYIFYSNIIKDFVYQKNYGDHHFEYGIKDKKVFDQKEYESYLPFVYWRNLDIQRKLPVFIDKKEFDKKQIKSSRLSFSYHSDYLKQNSIKLYPLFNPQSNKGIIKFPEEMFASVSDRIVIYSYDKNIDKKLSKELNTILDTYGIKYPLLNIWGKTTNMKPFDQGYILKDKDHKLFNIKRYDNSFEVKKIAYPKGFDPIHINISENKQKIFTGYAIGKDNSFYLLTWDFEFKKLEIPNFEYKNMRLKLISNPMNYLIRYSDGDNYYAVVFDKNLKKIKSVKF